MEMLLKRLARGRERRERDEDEDEKKRAAKYIKTNEMRLQSVGSRQSTV